MVLIILGDTFHKDYGLVGNKGIYCRGLISGLYSLIRYYEPVCFGGCGDRFLGCEGF